MRMRDWVVLSGNANRPLAQKICDKLGKKLGHAEVRRFSDGEVFVEIQENVRGRDVYVIQSTCRPVNDTLMELLIMIDALKRASAKEITAVVPYYGYARQDRKVAPAHSDQREARRRSLRLRRRHARGLDGPARRPDPGVLRHSVRQSFLLARDPRIPHAKKSAAAHGDVVLVSPDAGGVERARAYAKRLDARPSR